MVDDNQESIQNKKNAYMETDKKQNTNWTEVFIQHNWAKVVYSPRSCAHSISLESAVCF